VGRRSSALCRVVALPVDVRHEGVGRDAAEPADVDGLDLAFGKQP
jgi:hypothetical protein